MAKIVLILGESGTGKSTSMRNFKEGELALLNVAGKPLPFRGKFNSISSTDYRELSKFMKECKEDVIVVDDAQYVMSIQYMHRIKESGWDKYNELQSDFFNLIEDASKLPDNKIVYFLSHLENVDGRQKIKTIGKMLDEKITIEGLFSIVLKTYVSDNNYYFLTQNSGSDTVKSPMNMFSSLAIDNDLKFVDDTIRNYYYMDGAKTDEEIKTASEKFASEIDPTEKKTTRRSRKARKVEEVSDVEMIVTPETEITDEEVDKVIEEQFGIEVPAKEVEEVKEAEEVEKPKRRRRIRSVPDTDLSKTDMANNKETF